MRREDYAVSRYPESVVQHEPPRAKPGASTRSESRYANVAAPVQRKALPWDRREARVDPWIVQAFGGATKDRPDVPTVAAAGVQGASETLPFAAQIQRSFGRHDISAVRAATDGNARGASAAIGASAYATGDRVAFGQSPDLHTAAHEAAHVVQQRAGVSLAGGVGSSGDAYEQHADRVADLVVRGQSAEAALSEMSGSGRASSAVQRHDSPHHVAIGDSVSGEPITILGVEFSPGECAAFVDYVGPLVEFRKKCEAEQAAEDAATKGETVRRLEAMREMLRTGNEDTLMWDRLTDGAYSELSKKNEDHFAPDEDGKAPNHTDSFVGAFTEALTTGAAGQVEDGRMHMYTAEHFLQDSFSAGHMLAQPDIDAAIDELLTGNEEVLLMLPIISDSVYELAKDTIDCYRLDLPGLDPQPIGKAMFQSIVFGAFLTENGDNALVKSSLRKLVHEQLDAGVEVTSPAHPEPWTLHGDHDLGDSEGDESVPALQQALADVRDLFDANVASPVADPAGQAASLFAHHKPVPTGEGEATIAKAIESGTATRLLFMDAMVEAGASTVAGALDYAVSNSAGTIIRIENPNELHEQPDDIPELDRSERDPNERFVPEDRPSYFDSPNAPSPGGPDTAPETGERQSYFDSPGRSHTQVQLSETAPSPEPAPEPEAASSSALTQLRDAFDQGLEELERVARTIPTPDLGAAFGELPEIAQALLEKWWPDHTGWAATVTAAGEASADLIALGIPGALALDGETACEVSVRRTGASVVLGFKPSIIGKAEVAASIKLLEIPIGLELSGVLGASITVDLDRISWPGAAIGQIMTGDFHGALATVLSSVASVGKNTQVAFEAALGNVNTVGGQVGVNDDINALLTQNMNLGATYTAMNPTESAPGLLQFEGEVGVFMGLELGLAEGDLPASAPAILRLVEAIVELGGEAGVAAGMRLAITVPPIGSGGSFGIEIGLSEKASGSGTLLGQAGEAAAKGEIVLGLADIAAFVAALENGEPLGAAGLVAASSGLKAALSVGCNFKEIGVLELLSTWFPSLENVDLPESLAGSLSAELSVTAAEIGEMLARTGSTWAAFFEAAWAGDFQTALRGHADMVLENMADFVAMIKKVTIHVETTVGEKELEGGLEGPGADLGGSLSGKIAAVQHRELGPDEIGTAALEAWLRSLIQGGESWTPGGGASE